MRLPFALLLSPFLIMTAHAAEVGLECRAYGEMDAFAKKHGDFEKNLCAMTGDKFICEQAEQRKTQIQTCLATGQTYTHTQYIVFDDENLTGEAQKWAKPCWEDDTHIKNLKIAVSPDLTMSFYGGSGSTFNVNMKTLKGGYRGDRNHTCEIIDSSKIGVKTETFGQTGRAANPVDADAQYKLGTQYYTGKGLPKDKLEALKWYKKSAAQNHAKAQYKLGYLYSVGEKVPKDSSKAVKWIRKSAEQGYANAQYALGITYAHGADYPKDDKKAVKWYRKAAAQGHSGALYKVGYMYYEGRGVPQDTAEALKWFHRAAKHGDKNANNTIRILEREGVK